MDSTRQKFSKKERLCSRKIITALFESGNTFFTPEFKVIWDVVPKDSGVPAQVMFTVSKRTFRHAVERNLIKRRMREAFRKQKSIIYEPLAGIKVRLVFIVIYRNSHIRDYSVFESAIREMLVSLSDMLRKKAIMC